MLTEFEERGFVRIDHAFSRETANAALELLWKMTSCDRDDPKTWTRPVIRLGQFGGPIFREAANTPVLHAAFDELVGAGKWQPRGTLGDMVVRFPSTEAPGDDGWHVDASFPGADSADYFSYRVNAKSKGRALLMLFLFSDVGEDDAPTRIRIGSHRRVAKVLEPHGDDGLSFMELAKQLEVTADLPLAHAVGDAGTVYLCHPFLVHAAQSHRGSRPRFLAQPPLINAARNE